MRPMFRRILTVLFGDRTTGIATLDTPATPTSSSDVAAKLDAFEDRFRAEGLPSFIDDYSAGRNVFTRAAPWLALIALLECVGAASLTGPWWINLIAVLGAIAVVSALYLLLVRFQTGRWALWPEHVSRSALWFFILVPSLASLIGGGGPLTVLGIVALNLVILLLVYAAIAYGLVGTLTSFLGRMVGELADSVKRLMRSLPFLLFFSIVLFINAEMWQVFGTMPTISLWSLAVFFGALMVGFVLVRLRGDTNDVVATITTSSGVDITPLTRRQRINLGVLQAVSQLTQVLAVSLGIGVFFLALGALIVGADAMHSWGDIPVGTWSRTIDIGQQPLLITATHVRVAAAIAVFTGLYYSLTVMADSGYRAEFTSGLAEELEPLFLDREAYLEILDRHDSPTAATSP